MKKKLVLKLSFAMMFAFFAAPVLAFIPDDTYYDRQWYLGQISAPLAWDLTTGSPSVVVAVVDTGVDLSHPDIEGNIWVNPGEIPADGKDNDNNGFIDDYHGWDFIDDDNVPEPTYENGFEETAVSHGTVISGIIGAVGNNAEGIAGLNWSIRIMPIKTMDEFGNGTSADAKKAIYYAVDNGADVINLSVIGFDFDSGLQTAVQYAYDHDVLVVAAAGNSDDGGININTRTIYPACYKGSNGEDLVLGVAATDDSDKKADFSNYGSDCVDISAPGIDLFGAVFYDPEVEDLSYVYAGYFSGTSIAAPIVAGSAALLLSKYPSLTPEKIKTVLQLSADPIMEKGTLSAGQLGAGRINIAKAFDVAKSLAHGVSTPRPAVAGESSRSFVVAEAAYGTSEIRRYDSQGNLLNSFFAFESAFSGGLRLTMGDVNGDGTDEIIAAPGVGGQPEVRIFGLEGVLLGSFMAGEESYSGGLFIAAGDVDGDGTDEIIVSSDVSGDGLVKTYNMDGDLRGTIEPFQNSSFSLRVAAGDVDGDGKEEIIVGAGSGTEPLVRIFDNEGFVSQFYAYAETYNRGIFVGAGDIDGDGLDEIITGTDNGGGPHVRGFDKNGKVKVHFFAYDEKFRGGVRIAVGDIDRNGTAEIYTAAGPGGGPHARIFNKDGKVIGGFFVFDEEARNGINLGIW